MNITYIIGAGASAEAIPPVGKEFNQRFIMFCHLLIHYCSHSYSGPVIHRTFIERAVEELPKHYSVDTYARKLLFQNKKEYEAFKLLLSAYFLFEQMGSKTDELGIFDHSLLQNFIRTFPNNRKKLDSRYDVLYAALLDESKRQLPENIHFISWNYDVQFELSLKDFLQYGINNAFRDLKVYPGPTGRVESDAAKAQLLKLNGTAGLTYKRSKDAPSFQFFDASNGIYTKSNIDTTLDDIKGVLGNKFAIDYESMLHFAWENTSEVQAARKQAQQIIKETQILVVVGYSFPVYNRRIDREIFKYLQRAEVYIQVPEGDFERVSERFMNIAQYQGHVKQRKDLDQFFIPYQVI